MNKNKSCWDYGFGDFCLLILIVILGISSNTTLKTLKNETDSLHKEVTELKVILRSTNAPSSLNQQRLELRKWISETITNHP